MHSPRRLGPGWWFLGVCLAVGLGVGGWTWRSLQPALVSLPQGRKVDDGPIPFAVARAESRAEQAVGSQAGASSPSVKPSLSDDFLRWVSPPSDAAAIEDRLPAPARTFHYAAINSSLFAAKSSPLWKSPAGARVEWSFPGGERLKLVLQAPEILGPQRYTVQGVIEGRSGSRVILAFDHGALAAQVLDSEGTEYQVRTVQSAEGWLAQAYRVEVAMLKPCGGSPRPVVTSEILTEVARRRQARASNDVPGEASSSPSAAADDADTVTLRLLFLYTAAVRAAYGSPSMVQSVIDLAVAGVNADFANSQIQARLQLAVAEQVTLSETSIDYSRTLDRLHGLNDGFLDEIHARRDEVQADLVTLGVNGNDTGGSIGIAYILEEPSSYANAFFAFSVVQFGSMTANSVLSHELGHNLGCVHDRENSDHAGAYPYSYGYRFIATDRSGFIRQFRDIMAYAPGIRIPYFSNPRVTISQVVSGGTLFSLANPTPVGIAAGLPGEADNARTIQQSRFEVSHYRASPEVPVNAGTLINVSTRAFIGSTAQQQLIAGFVITGDAPKRMLLRGAGPSLLFYGVSDALADPLLKLYRAGSIVPFAMNDNWGEQPGAAETQVRGFPFSEGSRDAALSLVLEPGGYTANVEGVNGATGTALVEAYEIDAQAGLKLVNLSTRAYADQARPLVAGFVIAPDPVAPTRTKRVLVRVLGPSLTQYGVEGVLEDPLLRLYDHDGQLLLENDDWDPPNSNYGDGIVFRRGQVDQYSEQALFAAFQAAGLSSPQPVEPAVLLDLAPGLYTVVVVPFEELSSDQPARPGVGLVEVYEINSNQ